MPHTIVKLAERVIQNSENYSECVIARATNILYWNIERRACIKTLWEKYHSPFQECVVATRGSGHLKRQQITRNILIKHVGMSAKGHNDYYKCKGALKNRLSMEMAFLMLRSEVEASECSDIEMMHRYLCCVNAQRFDDTLESVGFLRSIPQNNLAEILLFRLKSKT